jgi:hypothetical protein
MSTIYLAASHAVTVLAAGIVNNPAPADPTSGSNGVNLLLSYAKWAP